MVFGSRKKADSATHTTIDENEAPIEGAENTKAALVRVFATGAGLFSDGYIANSISSVSSALSKEYGTIYTDSNAISNLSSISFVGTVVGQLVFGYLADHWSRINSLLVATVIMIIFTALCAGAYWHGEAQGTISILVAWRFFLGIGLGGEYLGSTGCAESTAELKSGSRNRWFILFTNTAIDWGFVFGAFVPYLVAVACHDNHYGTIWRTSIGIGIVWPIGLLILRVFIREPEEFSKNSMAHVKRVPYLHVFKFYGFRLLVISIIWFLYDFSTYSFGLYSNSILSSIYGDDEADLRVIYGYNTLINVFYLPGTVVGAFVSDWIGPRYCLALGVTLQAIVGFGMAGGYGHLARPENVAGFAVIYGIFLSLGELGPGNNIGLLASKTSATGIRGMYYGIAAAMGKIGAYVGTYIFPYIEAAGGSGNASAQYPFYVSSSLCLLSAILVLCFIPQIGQDTIQLEDARFRAYLESQGWDTSQLGLRKESADSVEESRVESVGGPIGAAEEKKL